MAITTSTFKVNAGWASSDVISQMGQAMVSLGWVSDEITGYIVGLGTLTGGGDTNASDWYEDVRPKSTTGVGTESSFAVYRDTVGVKKVIVNRPGLGYTSGEMVTLSADDIGGFSNGATDLSFKVCVDEIVGNGTTVSIALTTMVYQGAEVGGYLYAFDLHNADRAGVIGAGVSIITVREGDTISIANSYSDSYDPGIVSPHIYEDNAASSSSSQRVAGWDGNLNTADGYSEYTFKIGQAGTYLIKSYTNSSIGPEGGRVIVQPWSGDAADRTLVGYGTNTDHWDSDLSNARPYGIQKHSIAANKLYGNTYRSFRQSSTEGILDVWSFNGYMHYDGTEYAPNSKNGNTDGRYAHGGTGYSKRVAGASNLDFSTRNIGGFSNSYLSHTAVTNTHDYNKLISLSYNTNYGFDMDLNLFKSALDPRFVVFSYRYPTLSSTHLTSNTASTFFFHNFDSNLWDYDHVFLAGMTEILPAAGNTTVPTLTFKTSLSSSYETNGGGQKRAAEFPWQEYEAYDDTAENYVSSYYASMSYRQDNTVNQARLYYRSEDQPMTFRGGYPYQTELNGTSRVSPEANFNAVIKGIPININLIPCPYYLPEDFGLVEFYYNAANANIQQGDTFTISPSEVWTVITASYNQTTTTRGIAFCARTV